MIAPITDVQPHDHRDPGRPDAGPMDGARMGPDLDALERTVRAELGDAAFDKSYLDGHEAATAGRLSDLV